VELEGLGSVRLLDLLLGRVAFDPEELVEVLGGSDHFHGEGEAREEEEKSEMGREGGAMPSHSSSSSSLNLVNFRNNERYFSLFLCIARMVLLSGERSICAKDRYEVRQTASDINFK
jgi:hypothetical protein